MNSSLPYLLGFATLLCLVQVLAALPWLAAWRLLPTESLRRLGTWGTLLGISLGAGVALGLVLAVMKEPDRLEFWGQVYGSILQGQLAVDLLILVMAGMLKVWPRGGAVALAAFREGMRQPMFWLIVAFAMGLLFLFPFLPYFTFGSDVSFMKLISFEVIMLAAVAFGVLAASISISEEIDGKTAITLMSKPVSRRQFLLGKYAGILLACLAMTILLSWFFGWTLYLKQTPSSFLYDNFEKSIDLMQVEVEPWLLEPMTALELPREPTAFLRGGIHWLTITVAGLPGMATGFCQVMILLAIAAALATRLTMVLNMVVCLLLFFLSHLAPVMVQVAQNLQKAYKAEHGDAASDPLKLVEFASGLFHTLLPALEFLNLGPAIIRDQPLPFAGYVGYVGLVIVYSTMYTAIALLFGLILFEDRDLG